ncbi:hypothetical protein A1Q2_03007 [Trichosporon asahii var. asahii CBS 8904]|uniref:DUF1748-domain-containing protein n=2 Tax=Trichosporon asahii var. asahii TaxID=189963 RepID=K1VT87_TRIAC|nr:hypothetical protein A1Q1_06932 [Trichosporon asahii var. asahii CBS 2479]EJT51846.1 hypothetical protein A1Q1_06932 [Trichosporon asahii var. asahii CBS 2479]EKD02777.1 hypothetical protein A1Q2_03007 [Trichosporon asahii var. asahii CBS 8904]
MLGRLFHLGFDAIAVSTILSGVKKTTGFAPDVEQIPEPTVRSVAQSYLSLGDSCFNFIAGQSVTSKYFTKVN